MSHKYYSEINLHLTWHAKESLPLLGPQVQEVAYRYMRQKIINMPGAFVHEIGGIETHVHLASSVPPTLLISELVGQLKGASSHDVNEQLGAHGKEATMAGRLWRSEFWHGRFGLDKGVRQKPVGTPRAGASV